MDTIPKFYGEHNKLGQPYESDKPFITFLGAAGVGKSLTAARYAIREAREKFTAIHWQNCAELMMRIRATFKERSRENEDAVVRAMAMKELLVLDDLASEKVSDYSVSTLYVILNQRGEYARKTIVTSNLSLRQIGEQLGSRISDRLQRYGDVITLTAAATEGSE